jgi:hypothetical protein
MTWESQWRDQVAESALGVPSAPTAALPGTKEKVAVMARRHRDGERLWHPADPVIDWSPYAAGRDGVTAGRSPGRRGRTACGNRGRKRGYR